MHAYMLTCICTSMLAHTRTLLLIHTCINTRTQRYVRTLFLHLGLLGFDQFKKKEVYLSLYAY